MSVSKFSALIPSLQKISLTRVEGYVHAKTDYDQSMGSFLSKEPLDDAFEPEKWKHWHWHAVWSEIRQIKKWHFAFLFYYYSAEVDKSSI